MRNSLSLHYMQEAVCKNSPLFFVFFVFLEKRLLRNSVSAAAAPGTTQNPHWCPLPLNRKCPLAGIYSRRAIWLILNTARKWQKSLNAGWPLPAVQATKPGLLRAELGLALSFSCHLAAVQTFAAPPASVVNPADGTARERGPGMASSRLLKCKSPT